MHRALGHWRISSVDLLGSGAVTGLHGDSPEHHLMTVELKEKTTHCTKADIYEDGVNL